MRSICIASCTAMALLAGCYTLQPVGGMSPEVGTRVAFDVTDAGRLALGGSMGPEIGQIQGLLVGKENGEYNVAVSSVRFVRGGEQRWTGEQVNIKSEHVGRTYERRFSKGRTVVFGATLVGVAAIMLGSDLFALGGEPIVRPGDTTVTTFRGRRP